jgi:hypothetical protein
VKRESDGSTSLAQKLSFGHDNQLLSHKKNLTKNEMIQTKCWYI